MVKEHSAGVVAVHSGRCLLLHYTAGHWDFPKGHIEHGESAEQAALRELKEETGLEGKLVPGFRKNISYFYCVGGKTVSKEVTFFLAELHQEMVTLSHEHTDFVWLPFDMALRKLTFENARQVLTKVMEFLKHGEKGEQY